MRIMCWLMFFNLMMSSFMRLFKNYSYICLVKIQQIKGHDFFYQRITEYMKQKIFFTGVFAAVVALWSMALVSCGGGSAASGNSVVDEAIRAAEEAIALEDSPVFGTLPSLFKQQLEAGTTVRKHFRELKTEDMDKAAKNKSEGEEAEKALFDYFKKKISEAVEAIDGKSIKVEFDASQISSANVTLKATDKELAHFNIAFDVTLTQPVNKQVSFVWKFMDAEGNELESYNDYITPGEKFNKEWMVTADRDWAPEFDHLFIELDLF